MMVFNRNLLFQGSFSGSMLIFWGVTLEDIHRHLYIAGRPCYHPVATLTMDSKYLEGPIHREGKQSLLLMVQNSGKLIS